MATFSELPEEIVETIFMNLSPYGEIQTCRLVCRLWSRLASGAIVQLHKVFCRCKSFDWFLLENSDSNEYVASSIAERCSHSASYHSESANMYVFGGCTASYTTFNDLWRFDLARRLWVRPMPMGSYPTPKACATLCEYKNFLVLYGGWSKSSPNPIHQTVMFFRELHIYDPKTNFWTELTSTTAGPPLAGHSATIVNDWMVIFGGSYGSEATAGGISHGSGISNNIWVYDFASREWFVPPTSSLKPLPRYGQTQVKVDNNHILVIGGCGGPNLMYSDAWLLTISANDEWRWEEITISNPEIAAPQIWSHPGCLVGERVLFLSKPPRSVCCRPQMNKCSGKLPVSGRRGRTWIPPNEDCDSRASTSSDNDAGGQKRRGSLAPPRRRLISSKSLDEKHPPASTKSDRVGDKRPAVGELQRARSIPAIIVGEIPKLVVTHDGNDSGSSSSSAENCDLEEDSTTSIAGASSSDCSASVPQNRSISCVAMASSNFALNDARMVDPPSTFSNVEMNTNEGCYLSAGSSCSNSLAGDGPSSSKARQLPSTVSNVHNTKHPSVKPNAMRNRERQLEMLRRIENYIRSRSVSTNSMDGCAAANGSVSASDGTSPPCGRFRHRISSPPPKPKHNRPTTFRSSQRSPMQIYSLDVSKVLSNRTAAWSLLDDPLDDAPAPEDTILFSLVKGLGELILFGGMRSGSSVDTPGNLDVTPFTHMITNETYILKPTSSFFVSD